MVARETHEENHPLDMDETVKKYLRGEGTDLETLKDKKLKGQLAVREDLYGKSAKAAAKVEKFLMPTEGGFLEAEGIERTWRIKQESIGGAVDISSLKNQYDLVLPERVEREKEMELGAILSISIPPAARINAAAAVTTLSIRSRFSFLPRRLRLSKPSLSPFTYIDPNRNRTSSVTPQHLPARDNFRAAAALLGDGGTMLQDAGATVAVMAGAYGFVSVFDNLAKRNIIEQSLSRKLVHILSGLLFMGCWPIFSPRLALLQRLATLLL